MTELTRPVWAYWLIGWPDSWMPSVLAGRTGGLEGRAGRGSDPAPPCYASPRSQIELTSMNNVLAQIWLQPTFSPLLIHLFIYLCSLQTNKKLNTKAYFIKYIVRTINISNIHSFNVFRLVLSWHYCSLNMSRRKKTTCHYHKHIQIQQKGN